MPPPSSNPPPHDGGVPAEPELRFRTLFEQAPFSVQLLAVTGHTLQVNRAWEALWQVAEGDGLKDYVLNEYNILTDPQLRAKGITQYLARAFAGETVTTPAILYDPAELNKPGRARWVVGHASPITDVSGAVREVMLIHEDVTDRVEREHALRASELRLKQLANTIPQLAWMADPAGWIHWYNDRWYDYTGTTPAEMEGWGWQSVHDPQTLSQVIEQWKHSLATGEPFQMTFPLRGKDGVFRPFFTLVAPLKDADGNVVQWFGTNTDVSPLQAAEEELRRAEARLRLATEAGEIGIWDWDITRNQVTWSDRVYRLHGLAPGEFGGRVEDFSALVHPDDRADLAQKIERAVAEAGGFSAEFRVKLPDGRVRWLSTWARTGRAHNGRAESMVGATISIDAYKTAEAALKESDRRKDEFLAMLAHELRNPLAPVSTAAQLLGLPGLSADRVSRASEVIGRQVKHMSALVDDLLDVSRVTRGLVQVEKEALDLKSVIDSAIEQVHPLIEARGHALTTRIGDAPIAVHGDRTRLVQVIVNLLNNASKYTAQGGRIGLTTRVRGSEVSITIDDNGIGIEPGLLPNVFDLFTQAARTPDRSQGGLGIGLALVKSIVALHGGRVEARSDGLGKGSAFTLTIPLSGDAIAPGPQADEPPRQSAALRIMVVDDNLDAAQSLAALLEIDGHLVTVGEDAQSALDNVPRHTPDVFILDIGLPDMDGYQLVARLRATEAHASAVFIALTGYGQAHDRALSKAAGFDHHFVKPVDPQALMQILARLCRKT